MTRKTRQRAVYGSRVLVAQKDDRALDRLIRHERAVWRFSGSLWDLSMLAIARSEQRRRNRSTRR